ncbi:hypothetical protein [Citromicrobium bathyomarinum]|uniref:hypothetical protein n=1 Tax=Citromicrobium bathyomarinum TaxID=72174 RepID=UPI001E43A712|nr:hypothetical protein [Citromicrobium bathyomarinum]MCD1624027.1 hypothetical protein [Citromicrobium bathyomarinum]
MSDEQELEYRVRVITDRQTGKPLQECWLCPHGVDGFHRDHGPAELDWDADSGVVIREGYWQFGRRHRDNGPAFIRRDPESGKVTSKSWIHHGRLHREDGKPALQEIDPETGVIFREEYHEKGKPHRLDGPALITRDRKTGEVVWSAADYDDDDDLAANIPPAHDMLEP